MLQTREIKQANDGRECKRQALGRTGTWWSCPCLLHARIHNGCGLLGSPCCSCAAVGKGASMCAHHTRGRCTCPALRPRKYRTKIYETLQREKGCCCCCCGCLGLLTDDARAACCQIINVTMQASWAIKGGDKWEGGGGGGSNEVRAARLRA
jgi:hypothetical protein